MSSITLFPYTTSKDNVAARVFSTNYTNVEINVLGTTANVMGNTYITTVTGKKYASFFQASHRNLGSYGTVFGNYMAFRIGSTATISTQPTIGNWHEFYSGGDRDRISFGGVYYNVATSSANTGYFMAFSGSGATYRNYTRDVGITVLEMTDNDVGNTLSNIVSTANNGNGETVYPNATEYWLDRLIVTTPNTGLYLVTGSTTWSCPNVNSFDGGSFYGSDLRVLRYPVAGTVTNNGFVNSRFSGGYNKNAGETYHWTFAFVADVPKNTQFRLQYTGSQIGLSQKITMSMRNSSMVALYLPDFPNYYYAQSRGAINYNVKETKSYIPPFGPDPSSYFSNKFFIKNPNNKHLILASTIVECVDNQQGTTIRLFNESSNTDYNEGRLFIRSSTQESPVNQNSESYNNNIARVVTFSQQENIISWQTAEDPVAGVYPINFTWSATSIIILDLGTT